MDFLKLHDKFHRWTARLYTRLAASSFASLGKGSILYYASRFDNPNRISMGENVQVRPGVWLNAVTQWGGRSFSGTIDIGDHATIMDNVQISATENITIGQGVAIGRNSTIVDHNHDYRHPDGPIVHAPPTNAHPVTIGRNTMVAVGCVIAPGVTIGEHCFIAANAVVTRDIPPFSFASGNPARVRRRLDPETGKWSAPPQD